MDEWKEISIFGRNFIAINPRYGKQYWLGYKETFSPNDSKKSIYAVYIGLSFDVDHTFIRENEHGSIEVYTCQPNRCLLSFWSDGEDEPSIPAVQANYQKTLSRDSLEGVFAKKTLDSLLAKLEK